MSKHLRRMSLLVSLMFCFKNQFIYITWARWSFNVGQIRRLTRSWEIEATSIRCSINIIRYG